MQSLNQLKLDRDAEVDIFIVVNVNGIAVRRKISAKRTCSPHFFVHTSEDGDYAITHLATGHRIADSKTETGAMMIAGALSGVNVNWSNVKAQTRLYELDITPEIGRWIVSLNESKKK